MNIQVKNIAKTNIHNPIEQLRKMEHGNQNVKTERPPLEMQPMRNEINSQQVNLEQDKVIISPGEGDWIER